jgi:peroxiredoxin Q/BCP
MEAMPRMKVGDRAPEFAAVSHSGKQVKLADFLGRQPVVLFFYPSDGTPVCTAEACAFRDAYADFVQAGAFVIGVSGDSAESHRAFAANHDLPFLLISDAAGDIRRAFGVPRTLGILPGRVTYVIDKRGIIRLVFSSQFSARRHVTEALQRIKELADEQV